MKTLLMATTFVSSSLQTPEYFRVHTPEYICAFSNPIHQVRLLLTCIEEACCAEAQAQVQQASYHHGALTPLFYTILQ
jgi:hypothetical protein